MRLFKALLLRPKLNSFAACCSKPSSLLLALAISSLLEVALSGDVSSQALRACPLDSEESCYGSQSLKIDSSQSLLQKGAHLHTASASSSVEGSALRLDHDGIPIIGNGPRPAVSLLATPHRQPLNTFPVAYIQQKGSHISVQRRQPLNTFPAFEGGAATVDEFGAGNLTPEQVAEADRPITFITVVDPLLESNLAKSTLWSDRENLPHQWIVIHNNGNEGVSTLYHKAQASAAHDLMVFLHPDVMLPETWHDELKQKLMLVEDIDPNWGVLGTAGVGIEWDQLGVWGEGKILSSITDFATTWTSGSDNAEMQSLDEMCLILRRGSPYFDRMMPGFHFYGTDIVLSSRYAGMKAYLLNIPLKHKTLDAQGNPYPADQWYANVQTPEFTAGVGLTQTYVQQKWCHTGMLPVYGTAFDVVDACP